MSGRVHMVLDDREREAFRARASAEGMSLSEWLRAAGRERLERGRPARISTDENLVRFFASCDEREVGREPDWSEHLLVAGRSRGQSIEST